MQGKYGVQFIIATRAIADPSLIVIVFIVASLGVWIQISRKKRFYNKSVKFGKKAKSADNLDA